MLGVSLVLGCSVLTCVCVACWWAVSRGLPEPELRSFAFASLVFGNLALIHATRSRDRGAFSAALPANVALRWITAGTLAALALSVYLPAVAAVFRFGPLSPSYVAAAALAGVAGVLWYEAYKLARPRNRPTKNQ